MEEVKESATELLGEKQHVNDERFEQDEKPKGSKVDQVDESTQIEEKPSNEVQAEPESAGQSAEADMGGKEDLMAMYEESLRRVEEGHK